MKLNRIKLGLLTQIIIAIILGIILGNYIPMWGARLFMTFNTIFSEFLSFAIPLIILGLVTIAIADIGQGAGKVLLITVLIAYGSTVFSGLLSYFTSDALFIHLISPDSNFDKISEKESISPFFKISIPPVISVMTALVLSFTLGLGLASIKGDKLKEVMRNFQDIIIKLIEVVILPLLPFYIFSIFFNISYSGQAFYIISVFIKIIGIIFILHIVLLLIQYIITGFIIKQNPFKLLWNMMPAYITALGTQSSAATIPVTLKQTQKNGVSEETSGFVIPLCATIHLSGSILKIVACAIALMIMQGQYYDFSMMFGFILMLGITMVAAPGVPGGAIMAALGLLASMLNFDQSAQALMIALYITMDGFGTAGNITGDGAIALVVDKIIKKK